MFKVGDEVTCVDSSSCERLLEHGKEYKISHVGNIGYITVNNHEWLSRRFKLKEKQVKLKDIIKPFMRVQTAREGVWIAVQDVSSGEIELVSKYHGYNHIEDDYDLSNGCDDYNIVKVWHAPKHICNYLNFNAFGEIVWELPKPKTAQQIAVEELEASIKASQDKLEQLKRSL